MTTTKGKIVYKYGTGEVIPEGAVYLCTKVQKWRESDTYGWLRSWLVWHYFLVEVDDKPLADTQKGKK